MEGSKIAMRMGGSKIAMRKRKWSPPISVKVNIYYYNHHHPDDDDDPADIDLLPHDLVIENIIKRVRVKDLLSCGCVSKLWYNSIFRNPNFASSYFLQSQKNPTLMFYLLNVNRGTKKIRQNLFHVREHMSKRLLEFSSNHCIDNKNKAELVGNCNGLVCLQLWPTPTGEIMVSNPSRNELIYTYPEPYYDGYLVCYGFGFDPLTKEYKVVRIFRNQQDMGFKCMVYVLGCITWREAYDTAATLPTINFGTGISSDTTFYKSGVFCDGALFWRTKSDNETNLLLSFDLHDEKFQVIRLPAEFVAEQQQQQHQLVDHLIEFNGSPCVFGILEGGGGGGSNSTDDHDHRHPHAHDKSNNCCCAKVNLYYLLLNNDYKGKVLEQKKVWIKKTFDVCITSSSLPVAPCCFYNNTSSTPTRVLSYSGRVLLYWFDFHGECVQFYDLHAKLLKVVCSSSRSSIIARAAFENKKHTNLRDDAAAVNHKLSHMDYQLSCHVENPISFKDFIPEGAPRYSCMHELTSVRKTRRVDGFLCAAGNSKFIYSFN